MPKRSLFSHCLSNSNGTLLFNTELINHLNQKNQLSNSLLFLFKLAIVSAIPTVTAQNNYTEILDQTTASAPISYSKQVSNDGGNSNILGLIMLLSLLMLMILLRLLFTSKKFNSYCFLDDEHRQIVDNHMQYNYGAINQLQIELPSITSIPTHSYSSDDIEWSGQMKHLL